MVGSIENIFQSFSKETNIIKQRVADIGNEVKMFEAMMSEHRAA